MARIISPRIIRQLFVLLLITTMATLILYELVHYLSGILGAITIYVIFKKWMNKWAKKGWNRTLGASLLMFLSFVGILLPVTGVVLMMGKRVSSALGNSGQLIDTIKQNLKVWEERLGYEITSQIDGAAISTWMAENLKNAAGGTFTIFVSLAIMYFLLFYMFTARKDLSELLYGYVPVRKENFTRIGDEISLMVRSNALGIPLVAVAQGLVALIGFFIFGVERPFFWFVITAIGSMIPFIGTLIGILPVFLLSLAAGKDFQAWGILIYGIVVVGSTDNLIRLYVLKKLDDVHPLITLIGVIVGVPLFGFIGLIFGPLLLSLFLLLIRIYKRDSEKMTGNDTKRKSGT